MKNKIFYIFAFFLAFSFSYFSFDIEVSALNSGSTITDCVGVEWDSNQQDWILYYNSSQIYGLDFAENVGYSAQYEEFRKKKIAGEDIYILVVDFSKSEKNYYGLQFVFSDVSLGQMSYSVSDYNRGDHLWVSSFKTDPTNATEINYLRLNVLNSTGTDVGAYHYKKSYTDIDDDTYIPLLWDSIGISILYTNFDVYRQSSSNTVSPTGELLVESSFFQQNICDECSTPLASPTFELSYLTTTGDDTGDKIGANLTVNFQIYDTSKYGYYLSFDGGQSWDVLTPRLTSKNYTFTRLNNFEVIAKMVEFSTEKEVYSTFMTNSIDTSYHSKWVTFEHDDEYDLYSSINEKNYLYSATYNIYQEYNVLNNFPLTLYYSYDNSSWKELPHSDSLYLIFNENKTVYFIYRDISGQVVYTTMYDIDLFWETETLGETINFSEECNEEFCVINATFLNYDTSHLYWIRKENQVYSLIDIENRNGVYSWTSSVMDTYCAKITDVDKNIILEKCFTSYGSVASTESNTNVFNDIFGNSRTNIIYIFDSFTKFYNELPIQIQNMFYLILFLALATFAIKFFI